MAALSNGSSMIDAGIWFAIGAGVLDEALEPLVVLPTKRLRGFVAVALVSGGEMVEVDMWTVYGFGKRQGEKNIWSPAIVQ